MKNISFIHTNKIIIMPSLKVTRCPSDELVYTNLLYVSPGDYKKLVPNSKSENTTFFNVKEFVYTIGEHHKIEPGHIGIGTTQRKCLKLAIDDIIEITPVSFNIIQNNCISVMKLQVETLIKNPKVISIDCSNLNDILIRALEGQFLTINQMFIMDVNGSNLQFRVNELEVFTLDNNNERKSNKGLLVRKSGINVTSNSNVIRLLGAKSSSNTSFRPNFNFESMGIGGLEDEFGAIFRRAFAFRIFPQDFVNKLGIKHVKGILLYGPPGTGKTLMARQIGKMLNGREPKVVNGPEILNKYIGQSEENIRKLFEDAEKEYAAKGDNSDLHIIIFDEIDSICKSRGTTGGNTGVGDTVVNQLLSKIDGINSLNNILLIGMTNRKDMIDEALLRPGRLEVQIEISLPDEKGRLQILKVHMNKMCTNGYLDPSVDLNTLASLTKNFTGAEIEGLVKSATSFAFNRCIDGKKLTTPDDPEKIRITYSDFQYALNEVVPAFGVTGGEFKEHIRNGIVDYSYAFRSVLDTCKNFIEQLKNSERTTLISILLEGNVGSGKTALAASLAMNSEFPFAKIISPEDLVDYSEAGKCSKITKIFQDAYKSPLSVIVLDNIERLLEYVPIGPRFSNNILQILLVLTKKVPKDNKKLLIIGTTSHGGVLEDMGFGEAFDVTIQVPNVGNGKEIQTVLQELNVFSTSEIETINKSDIGNIPIKKLLMIVEMVKQESDIERVNKFVDYVKKYSM